MECCHVVITLCIHVTELISLLCMISARNSPVNFNELSVGANATKAGVIFFFFQFLRRIIQVFIAALIRTGRQETFN